MTTVVIAEKPSVARDLARAVGAGSRGNGFLRGNGFVVTWSIGHLVRLAEPGEIEPSWRAWRSDQLPMLPREWPLVVIDRTREQYRAVEKILADPEVREVVCATDAGREGELIFRYLYDRSGCAKPVRRLWVSSLTGAAIRAGFERLRPGEELEPLAAAARGRSRADWLVGMNLSRANSLVFDETFSVGRVQTPTLAMLVERELEIRSFEPQEYFEVEATFGLPPAIDTENGPAEAGAGAASYRGVYCLKPERGAHRFLGGAAGVEDPKRQRAIRAAEAVIERVRSGRAEIHSLDRRRQRIQPPQLYDLTELQRHANRLYGFSAKRTLAAAQQLYERQKLITYPRTDSKHLPSDLLPKLVETFDGVAEPYEPSLQARPGERGVAVNPGRRYVDDSKVTDHHAILPTTQPPDRVRAARARLDSDQSKVFDLVCRRFLSIWQLDHLLARTKVVTAVVQGSDPSSPAAADWFVSDGSEVERLGWKVLEPKPSTKTGRARSPRPGATGPASTGRSLPTGLEEGLPLEIESVDRLDKTTRPPKRFTDATLLSAMETAGKKLDDRELSAAMKDRGLGTPATRAEIIETLVRREYIERQRKNLVATERGIRLIDLVHPDAKSPRLTGEWEAKLRAIERGELDLDSFMESIESFVREVTEWTLGRAAQSRTGQPRPGQPGPTPSSPALRRVEPKTSARAASQTELFQQSQVPRESSASVERPTDLGQLLSSVFGFESFRPHQESVCRSVIAGQDGLLVMPTGAGKSLCYQLPGLALAGTTLVISPLIALMEDQALKLRELGLAAERIHSGRPREESRSACRAYLDGQLDFLFIAPERLSVAGFPELLARRKPVLVAIDEAHCISHWGHDFRPEYRLLGGRLKSLRPAPVLALTATATPRVQEDIVSQLGIANAGRFIHGFRRQNLAIEVVEVRPSARAGLVERLLDQARARPAIVYTPTRKESESLAARLAAKVPAAPYHAGLPASRRDEVQSRFLAGEIDVVVATIAFGMGIDKPDVRSVLHTALPSTVEGYYQEIGRAGRDGLDSRAVLLYSWADRKTHEFFHQRDYPEVDVLSDLFQQLSEEAESSDRLQRRVRIDEDVFENALDKLWVHGGAVIEPGGRFRKGATRWREPYVAQRDHRLEQLAEITRYASSSRCRMRALVDHFGDREDKQGDCGRCDVCKPGGAVATDYREPGEEDLRALEAIVEALRQRNGQATGRLFKTVSASCGWLVRAEFEELLAGLARSKIITLEEASFDREGETIHYRRAVLGRGGRAGANTLRQTLIADRPPPAKRKRKRKSLGSNGGASISKGRRKRARSGSAPLVEDAPPQLVEALRQWRLEESRRQKVPAFRVLTNRTLLAIAAQQPRDHDELLGVSGIGPAKAGRYGEDLLRICQQEVSGQ